MVYSMDDRSTCSDPPATHKGRRTLGEWFKKYFLAGQKTNEEYLKSGGSPSCLTTCFMNHRKIFGVLIPFLFVQIIYWTLATEYGFYKLFATRYEMSCVMAFGAFVGGATAEGSGAIAFPVMTLILKVPAETARDFAVMIQTIGMNSAAVSAQIQGVLIEKHTFIFCFIGGTVGTILSLEFLDPLMGGDTKKIMFVSVFFSFAIALYLLNKEKKRITYDQIQNFDVPRGVLLLIVGFAGGLFSGLCGSGLDVFAFSVITLLFKITEKVATPTTVSLAGTNSAVAFFWRYHKMHAIDQLAWEYFAVCVPIVCLCGPLGLFVASHFHRQTLAFFLYILETIALVTALIILLPPWPLWVMSVGIIVFAFFFYRLLIYLGTRFAAGTPRIGDSTVHAITHA